MWPSDWIRSAARVNRGSAYAMTGDLERAIADYRHAIDMDPEHPKVYESVPLVTHSSA
jgi:Flp pilus assembly protein TadD